MLMQTYITKTIDQVDEFPKVIEEWLIGCLVFAIHQLIIWQINLI